MVVNSKSEFFAFFATVLSCCVCVCVLLREFRVFFIIFEFCRLASIIPWNSFGHSKVYQWKGRLRLVRFIPDG